MDTLAWTALAAFTLTLIALAYWRLRGKSAATRKLAGEGAASSSRANWNSRTKQSHIAHDNSAPTS